MGRLFRITLLGPKQTRVLKRKREIRSKEVDVTPEAGG